VTAAYRSPLWILGLASSATAATVGYHSPLAFWVGGSGVSSTPPAASAGYFGLLAWWVGGAGSGTVPPVVVPQGLYSRTILPTKMRYETGRMSVDFISLMQSEEVISQIWVTATTYSGEDSVPSDLLSGSASSAGTVVSQFITGGVEGVVYDLVYTIKTDQDNYYTLAAFLAITLSYH